MSVAEALSSAVRCVQYQVAQATEPPQTAWAVISAVRQLGPLAAVVGSEIAHRWRAYDARSVRCCEAHSQIDQPYNLT